MPTLFRRSRRASSRSGRRSRTAKRCCRSILAGMAALSGPFRNRAGRLCGSERQVGDLETKIRKLREALEPQAAMISDIPPFDLKLGYELYAMLLKPVEAAGSPRRISSSSPTARSACCRFRCCRRRRPKSRKTTMPCSRLSEGPLAGADPRRHDGAVGGRIAHAAAIAAGQADPRRADRIRRSLFSKEQKPTQRPQLDEAKPNDPVADAAATLCAACR